MGVSNVMLGGSSLMDITDTTATPESVLEGYIFYAANGNRMIGTAKSSSMFDDYIITIPYRPNLIDVTNTNFNDISNRIAWPGESSTIRGYLIGDNVKNCSHLFQNMVDRFYIRMGNGIVNCAYMFNNIQNANLLEQPINIPDATIDCGGMFFNCLNYNYLVTFGNNVSNCSNMFNRCWNFNQPINMSNSITNCEYMFESCYNFNQPIIFSRNMINACNMFRYCRNFNQPITLYDNLDNCASMFENCYAFDRQVIIPNTVTNCANMFAHCSSFNPISMIIPNSVNNAYYMFNGTRFIDSQYSNKNIFIKRDHDIYLASIIYGHSNYARMNIYCNNLDLLKNYSLTGYDTSSSWRTTTNGYYNSSLNVYLYKNMPAGI